MYLEHFGLREFPFSLAPDPRYLYLSAQHREALAHLLYGVQSEGGFVQLTGEVGTGKTTVCRCFLEQLPPGTRAAVILNPGLTAEELLAAICDEFEIPQPAGAGGVKASLDRINALPHRGPRRRASARSSSSTRRRTSTPAVLEQLRLLTNLETSRHKLLQIILMGQPELRATLARPELRQLAQRITARFHLRPLTREETAAYVRHRLAVAGCPERALPRRRSCRLRRLSRGVPRLINILCDRALLGAFVQGKRRVDRATLAQAAREVAGRRGRGAAAVAAARARGRRGRPARGGLAAVAGRRAAGGLGTRAAPAPAASAPVAAGPRGRRALPRQPRARRRAACRGPRPRGARCRPAALAARGRAPARSAPARARPAALLRALWSSPRRSARRRPGAGSTASGGSAPATARTAAPRRWCTAWTASAARGARAAAPAGPPGGRAGPRRAGAPRWLVLERLRGG